MSQFYSCRAECMADVSNFIAQLHSDTQCNINSINVKRDESRPDVTFEMCVSNITVEDLISCVDKVPDGHVMKETMRAVPLSNNNLKRVYGGCPLLGDTTSDLSIFNSRSNLGVLLISQMSAMGFCDVSMETFEATLLNYNELIRIYNTFLNKQNSIAKGESTILTRKDDARKEVAQLLMITRLEDVRKAVAHLLEFFCCKLREHFNFNTNVVLYGCVEDDGDVRVAGSDEVTQFYTLYRKENNGEVTALCDFKDAECAAAVMNTLLKA